MDNNTTEQQIRQLVRAAIGAELAHLKNAESVANQVIAVTIESDSDLMAFARRILQMADDAPLRQRFESGQIRFQLNGNRVAAARQTQTAAPTATVERIEQGVVSERIINALPAGTSRLLIGKKVCLTPLARDRARQLSIVLERFE